MRALRIRSGDDMNALIQFRNVSPKRAKTKWFLFLVKKWMKIENVGMRAFGASAITMETKIGVFLNKLTRQMCVCVSVWESCCCGCQLWSQYQKLQKYRSTTAELWQWRIISGPSWSILLDVNFTRIYNYEQINCVAVRPMSKITELI